MRSILLAVLLTGALCLTPQQCDLSIGDEQEYFCPFENANVTFTTKRNDYVKILCEGTDINCADIPYFNFATGLPLRSLGVSSCPPSILPCVMEHIDASSLEIMTLTRITAPLTRDSLEQFRDVRMLMIQQAGSPGLLSKSEAGLSCPTSILPCVLEHIDASILEIMTLTRITAPLTRDSLEQFRDVRMLMMQQAEAEKSFPAAVVSTFPTLRRLSIDGGDFQLTPNIFVHAPPLKYLELSKDQISSIPPGSFQGLGSLNELNIWGNPLENITVGAFRGLDNLEKLTLTRNDLKSIEVGVFSDTAKLKSLYMMANNLETIPNGLLRGLDQLENITIQMNQHELTIETHAFSNLPSLQNILIKYTTTRHLAAGVFNGSSSISSIQMNYNNIENLSSNMFLSLKVLKRLDLSNNRIKELPSNVFRGLVKLEYLNMNRNFIEVLPDGLFDGMTHLKEIHIDFNSISTIGFTSFTGARNLHTLSLSSNQLTLDPGNPSYLFIDDDFSSFPSPFNFLVRLVKLNLSHNKIRSIWYDWEAVLLQLEVLDLSYNEFNIIEFDHRATNFLSPLTVDLRHNNITTIFLDKPIPEEGSFSNATFLLDHNPIDCNCAMYGLRIRLNGTRYSTNEPKFELGTATCASPPNLQGQVFAEVSPDNLVCEIPEYPPTCSSCIAKVASNEVVFNCEEFPALPDVSSPNISYYFVGEPTITVNLKKQPLDLKNENIHTLNLSSTGIKKIDFRPTTSLKVLDVSNNELTAIPMAFLASNITLYLANNPLECECWYADDIAKLQRYTFIADYAQITCANGDKIALIDTTALCKTWKASIVAVATFVILAVFVLISALLVHRYSNEILVYMTSRGICRCCLKEILQDKDKEYDVFLSFAHQDLALVEDDLLPMLENNFNQKVCVHYRDWVVGDMIPTQILRSVENSRKTIIILSENFLESIWANLEFCAAHNLALQEGKARVILILLDENLSKHSNLSEELKAYIATNTYLLWKDPKFLEKLRKVLPRRKHTFTWLDALKQRGHEGEKEGIIGLDVQLNSEGKLVNIGKKAVNECKIEHHQLV